MESDENLRKRMYDIGFNEAIDKCIQQINGILPFGKYEYNDDCLSKRDIFKLINDVENLKKK